MENKKIDAKSYLIYGGGSRPEFKKVYPKLQYENYKIWRLMSVLLLFVAAAGVIYNVAFERSNSFFLFNLIIYAVLAVTYLITACLLFFGKFVNKPVALSWIVYSTGSLSLIAAVVSACIEIQVGSLPIAFAFALALGGFLYLDRPVKNIVMFTTAIIPYTIVSIINGGGKYLFPTLVVWALGLIISSYTNFRRIHNHIEMIRFEKLGNTDSLTGVYNKNKYDDTVNALQAQLKVRDVDFAVVVFDVNRLKETNDTYGHPHGDALLKRAVNAIKEVFQNSDVYRIGGDEFCCILTGEDYEHRSSLISSFHKKIETIHKQATSLQRDTSVAAGFATYDAGADTDYMMVFSRADKNMYRNKVILKSDNKFARKEAPKEEIIEEPDNSNNEQSVEDQSQYN